jgi:hypothetical protein
MRLVRVRTNGMEPPMPDQAEAMRPGGHGRMLLSGLSRLGARRWIRCMPLSGGCTAAWDGGPGPGGPAVRSPGPRMARALKVQTGRGNLAARRAGRGTGPGPGKSGETSRAGESTVAPGRPGPRQVWPAAW